MYILQKPISKQELKEKFSTYFDSMTKAVVDITRKVVAVDAELHADLEARLLEEGSFQENLWGVNLYPGKKPDDFIEFTALINIRPSQDNNSMEVSDPGIKKAIIDLVETWIHD